MLTLLVATWAVKLPKTLGLTTKVTVNVVAVDAVTVPVALLLKVIVLRDAVVSKPIPLIVIVDAFGERPVVLLVMIGTTVAT